MIHLNNINIIAEYDWCTLLLVFIAFIHSRSHSSFVFFWVFNCLINVLRVFYHHFQSHQRCAAKLYELNTFMPSNNKYICFFLFSQSVRHPFVLLTIKTHHFISNKRRRCYFPFSFTRTPTRSFCLFGPFVRLVFIYPSIAYTSLIASHQSVFALKFHYIRLVGGTVTLLRKQNMCLNVYMRMKKHS